MGSKRTNEEITISSRDHPCVYLSLVVGMGRGRIPGLGCEYHLCHTPLGRPVSSKADKSKLIVEKKNYI